MPSSRTRNTLSVVLLLVLSGSATLVGWWTRQSTKAPESGASSATARAAAVPATARATLELPEAEREFLWNLEHHGNVLNKFGFRPLWGALAQEDLGAVENDLAPAFQARLFAHSRSTRLNGEIFDIDRQERDGDADRALSAAEFSQWLKELREPFSPAPKFDFGISSLSPIDRDDIDGAWQGTGKLRLWGFIGADQPAETVVVIKFQTIRPRKSRLNQGAWLLNCSIEQVGRATSRQYLFRETAEVRGLEPERLYDNWKEEQKVGQTGGIFTCDFNRDGCVDILVTDLNFPGVALYMGTPSGVFKNATREVGLLSPAGGLAEGFSGRADDCVFADLDNDGWEDLIVLAGGLFRNIEGQRFEPVTHRSNLFAKIFGVLGDRSGPSTILPADFDRDGLIDLYVVRTGMLRDAEAGWIDEEPLRNAGNQLLRNLGKGRFEDVTERSGTAGGNRSVFTAAWLDANNDGWPDVYVINELGKGLLLVNQNDSTFREHELVRGPADFGSMGLAVGDIDNDGNIDLYSANMYSKAGNRVIGNLAPGLYAEDVLGKLKRLVQGSRLYRNQGDLSFAEVGRRFQVHDVGWAWGTALADLNNDGWLDVYATAGYMSRDRTKPDG